jgi:hypothetical protein
MITRYRSPYVITLNHFKDDFSCEIRQGCMIVKVACYLCLACQGCTLESHSRYSISLQLAYLFARNQTSRHLSRLIQSLSTLSPPASVDLPLLFRDAELTSLPTFHSNNVCVFPTHNLNCKYPLFRAQAVGFLTKRGAGRPKDSWANKVISTWVFDISSGPLRVLAVATAR